MAVGKRRGIRASRIRLEAALAASDLPRKTQAALADAIADREELDAAPKDLVSKLFRELPVDPQTIERVAAVLGVEAATLYRTETDPPFPNGGDIGPPPMVTRPERVNKWLIAWPVLAIFALIGIAYAVTMESGPAGECRDGLVGAGAGTPPDRLGLIIAGFAGDPEDEARTLLAHAFKADERLSRYVEVFTTCRRLALPGRGAYGTEVEQMRALATRDLEAVDAQLLIWGERYGDRLNIRFATRRGGDTPVRIDFDDQAAAAVSEADFTFPMRLGAERPVPSTLKHLVFAIMNVDTEQRASLRQRAVDAYSASSEWLRDAIVADRNLIRSLSPRTNPRLYMLTGNQLCYRHRLLGEIEGREDEFVKAEEICKEVLSRVSRTQAPQEWASLQINLASVIIRRHVFAPTTEQRVAALRRALDEMEKAETAIDRQASPDNFATYHRNLGVVHLRLGELIPGEAGARHFEQGIGLTETALTALDAAERPFDYSQARQNLCVLKHRLGDRTDVVRLFDEAIADCRAATETVSPTTEPQAWAMAQNNLAISHALAAEKKRDPSELARAMGAFELSQSVYTRENYAANWAEVEANKAELSCRLAVMTRNPAPLARSVRHGELALQVFQERQAERYVDYVSNLMSNVEACNRSAMEQCTCSS